MLDCRLIAGGVCLRSNYLVCATWRDALKELDAVGEVSLSQVGAALASLPSAPSQLGRTTFVGDLEHWSIPAAAFVVVAWPNFLTIASAGTAPGSLVLGVSEPHFALALLTHMQVGRCHKQGYIGF